MKDEKVQNAPEMPATDNAAVNAAQAPGKPPKPKFTDWLKDPQTVFKTLDKGVEVSIIPIQIQRKQFSTNAGDLLYGYFIPVQYYGEVVDVRLKTVADYDPDKKRNVTDKRGYFLYDLMFSHTPVYLGLSFTYYPESTRLRSINYHFCGLDEDGIAVNTLPVDVDRQSSESVLRSAINRLRRQKDLDFQEF